MSDLHFEQSQIQNEYSTWPQTGWPVKAPYLVLAGDIGSLDAHYTSYRDFLAMRCKEYKKVFLITGNRDFPTRNMQQDHAKMIKRARGLERDVRMGGVLKFLENDRYDLKDKGVCISILGCTLWTQTRADHSRWDDYDTTRGLEGIPGNSRDTHNQRYQESLQWLRDEVKKIRASPGGKERKIMVITHHTPFMRDASKDSNDVRNKLQAQYSYYNNDILGGCGLEGLGVGDMWIYGHTHWTNDLLIDDVRAYSNQRGNRCPKLIEHPGHHDFDIQRTVDL